MDHIRQKRTASQLKASREDKGPDLDKIRGKDGAKPYLEYTWKNPYSNIATATTQGFDQILYC
jgi:hypothetical protein